MTYLAGNFFSDTSKKFNEIKSEKMQGVEEVINAMLDQLKAGGVDITLVTMGELLEKCESLLKKTCNAYQGKQQVEQLNSWTTEELAKRAILKCFTPILEGQE